MQVPVAGLETPIRKALLDTPAGVRVLYARSGTGKTTAAKHVIQSLQASGELQGALVTSCREVPTSVVTEYNGLSKWIIDKCSIGVPFSLTDATSSLFASPKPATKRTVLFFDQFDHLAQRVTDEQLDSFIAGMAEDAQNTNKFTVLLAMRNEELAEVRARIAKDLIYAPVRMFVLRSVFVDRFSCELFLPLCPPLARQFQKVLGFNGNQKITKVKVDETPVTVDDLRKVIYRHVELGSVTFKVPKDAEETLIEKIVEDANCNMGQLIEVLGDYRTDGMALKTTE
jgi:hypothetical protein